MKFYIASKLENAAQVSRVADALKAAGHVHTYDWTVHGPVHKEGLERVEEVALLDAQGVLDADVVVALLPGGRGTHVEIGIGIGAGTRIILCAPDKEMFYGDDVCAFYWHKNCIRCVGDELAWITEILAKMEEVENKGKIIKPSVDDMIRALKACAVDTPQEGYPCESCYLYPFSRDGHMSTGRTCFEHLTLDVIAKLRAEEAG